MLHGCDVVDSTPCATIKGDCMGKDFCGCTNMASPNMHRIWVERKRSLMRSSYLLKNTEWGFEERGC